MVLVRILSLRLSYCVIAQKKNKKTNKTILSKHFGLIYSNLQKTNHLEIRGDLRCKHMRRQMLQPQCCSYKYKPNKANICDGVRNHGNKKLEKKYYCPKKKRKQVFRVKKIKTVVRVQFIIGTFFQIYCFIQRIYTSIMLDISSAYISTICKINPSSTSITLNVNSVEQQHAPC